MIRIPFPSGVSNTVLRHPRTLDQHHPYLRSSSVCLTTATSGDAAEIAAQKRIDRIVMAACGAAAVALWAMHKAGWLL